jgi:riboflavin kinase/FMN adenylyltransferase
MRLVRDNSTTRLAVDPIVTIGNFDGIHRGHRVLIERCRELAGNDREVALVTFEPLPQAFFSPVRAPARLTSVRQKLQQFRESGIDLVWMMRFNQHLASMSVRDFVRQVLVRGLSAGHVVVGDDFRFGKDRSGDHVLLGELGREFGFAVEAIRAVTEDGQKISSSVVREALAGGDLVRTGRLLGRPFSMQGRVFRGSQLGRKLGYPTANMKLAVEPSPLAGVFAVQARVLSGPARTAWLNGVASLGTRPVVGGGDFLVEVHFFDFEADLYGRRLEVRFIRKLRDEANFESLDALVAQMRKDEAQARDVLQMAG